MSEINIGTGPRRSSSGAAIAPVGPVAAVKAASAGPSAQGKETLPVRVLAAMIIARYHGGDPDPEAVTKKAGESAPSAPVLVEWLRQSGLWARATQISFSHLLKIESPAPVLLLLADGGAALVVGRN